LEGEPVYDEVLEAVVLKLELLSCGYICLLWTVMWWRLLVFPSLQ